MSPSAPQASYSFTMSWLVTISRKAGSACWLISDQRTTALWPRSQSRSCWQFAIAARAHGLSNRHGMPGKCSCFKKWAVWWSRAIQKQARRLWRATTCSVPRPPFWWLLTPWNLLAVFCAGTSHHLIANHAPAMQFLALQHWPCCLLWATWSLLTPFRQIKGHCSPLSRVPPRRQGFHSAVCKSEVVLREISPQKSWFSLRRERFPLRWNR